MAIMTYAKFHFNWLMLTSIFGIWASEPPPPRAWRTTEKAGPDRVKALSKECDQSLTVDHMTDLGHNMKRDYFKILANQNLSNTVL